MSTLITGGTGFIGGRLAATLAVENIAYRMLVRRASVSPKCVLGDLGSPEQLMHACEGMTDVFHCAGYAHAFDSQQGQGDDLHWRVNFEGTRNLAEAAGRNGVRHFVFLSSVKAMADPGIACVDESFPGMPDTAYGKAKRAAESAVLEAGSRFGMRVTNLRLSMVYGRGGRGNLERMARLIRRGWFPPLPENGNHRSLVHVDDVVSAMRLVVTDTRADGQTYIIAGNEAPSGRQLFDLLRSVQGLPPCHWSVPQGVLQAAAWGSSWLQHFTQANLPFNQEVLDRLLGSAWYSAAAAERELGWRPQIRLIDGLTEMVSL